ncbi:ABC transporter permease [Microbacterium betulae]|uniref:ABC transporter permease n=1 Tax=Microbacterium betulae TaxID=2981139 RepID=A0AA97FGT8_9MICO|nr:ABC transporter permease [Microbacterium sp. AB]WOF22913.1 ABC transporter permease [Microbacterium sp. AB]
MTLTTLPAAQDADGLIPSSPDRRRGRVGAALRHTGLVLAVAVLATVVAWAFLPSLFAPADPLLGVGADKLLPPGAGHLFGTDQLGRDLFSRVVHGASLSLAGAVTAVATAIVVGSALGLLAGYLGGWVDDAIMRLTDVFLAVPNILMSMAIITIMGRGATAVALAVGLAGIGGIARTMRSEVLKVKVADYVEASRAGGARWWEIAAHHVLPNARGPIVVLIAIEFGQALLAIAGLSFLGYGEPPPAPEWGALVSGGRDYLATSWWLVTLPGLVIVAVVLSTDQVSRVIQARYAQRSGR